VITMCSHRWIKSDAVRQKCNNQGERTNACLDSYINRSPCRHNDIFLDISGEALARGANATMTSCFFLAAALFAILSTCVAQAGDLDPTKFKVMYIHSNVA
jgi:hypothetical protein